MAATRADRREEPRREVPTPVEEAAAFPVVAAVGEDLREAAAEAAVAFREAVEAVADETRLFEQSVAQFPDNCRLIQ